MYCKLYNWEELGDFTETVGYFAENFYTKGSFCKNCDCEGGYFSSSVHTPVLSSHPPDIPRVVFRQVSVYQKQEFRKIKPI